MDVCVCVKLVLTKVSSHRLQEATGGFGLGFFMLVFCAYEGGGRVVGIARAVASYPMHFCFRTIYLWLGHHRIGILQRKPWESNSPEFKSFRELYNSSESRRALIWEMSIIVRKIFED